MSVDIEDQLARPDRGNKREARPKRHSSLSERGCFEAHANQRAESRTRRKAASEFTHRRLERAFPH